MRKVWGFIIALTFLFEFVDDKLMAQHGHSHETMLVGLTDWDDLVALFPGWLANEQNSSVDKVAIDKIGKRLTNFRIMVFLGTWCEDSERYVPEFMHVLKALQFPQDRLMLWAMNREKKIPNQYFDELHITHVPTMVFFGPDGKECGRITEQPKQTITMDILEILECK